ncbi:hypothetical protein [Haladaptatus sp. DYF46]|uniref:hypothetical protein n=1 Tax=Haladaptatus sp. DYF46 TaxID=2886041 RepID=UPI001E322F26|nr:hypothetical protein [Haladaptatus sp. DYF46]
MQEGPDVPLESDSEVHEMHQVQAADGSKHAPASDSDGWEYGTDIDINNGGDGVTVRPYIPGRPSRIAVHVEASAAFRVQLNFEDADENPITSRSPSDNPDYQSDGSSDVFVSATPVSRHISIDIEDTSGGPNTADYSVLVI